jgi:long-chain acyl-CoA synthetase
MTETAAGACIMHFGDPHAGIVGGPMQNTKFKLRDIPEMGYLHTNPVPQGELLIKGGSVMSGYFSNPQKTAEAFDKNNWLRSGDVACIFPNGAVKIIDRAKNIFKLSQGEYIAPEKLENVYLGSPYV